MDIRFLQKVSHNNEDVVTEFLVSIMNHRYVRTAVLKSLFSGLNNPLGMNDVSDITYESIKSQSTLKSGGRVDIAIESPRCKFFIENKIGNSAPFQTYQTTTYPQEIYHSHKKYKGLVFLLPDNYDLDKNSILGMCESSLKAEGLQPGFQISDYVCIKYWSEFYQDMMESEIQKDNQMFSFFTEYIKNRLSCFQTFVFTRGDILTMFDPKTVERVLEFRSKWYQFIYRVDEYVRNKHPGLLASDFTGFENGGNGLGKYLRLNGSGEVAYWFGYEFRVEHTKSNFFCCINVSHFHEDLFMDDDKGIHSRLLKGSFEFIPVFDPEWVYFEIPGFFLDSEDWDKNIELFGEEVIRIINLDPKKN